jgi:hypothetical protein
MDGALDGASRRSSPIRTGIPAAVSTVPTAYVPAHARCSAQRGTARPSMAASDWRQASLRATSAARCRIVATTSASTAAIFPAKQPLPVTVR